MVRPLPIRLLVGVAVGAVAAMGVSSVAGSGTIATGEATTGAAAAKPTLAVVVVGRGRVTSKPAGISCPGKCSATFAAGSRVLLTPKAKTGSRFLRWGGDCTGTRTCRVRVSALAAVAAQFVGPKTQPKPSPKVSIGAGGYSGSGSTGYRVAFYVPAGAGSVLDFSTSGSVLVNCAGGGQYGNPFKILKTTIKRDRSFTAKTSQTTVVSGASATITYFVTGRYQGRSATGAATFAGVFRQDIVFTDTPNRKCTSNDHPWTAARSLAPSRKSIEPGTYSGSGSTGYRVAFLVPGGAGSVLDFSTSGSVLVNCAGGGQYGNPFKIPKATIKLDRSFTAKTSQTTVVSGAMRRSRPSSPGTSRVRTLPGRRRRPGFSAKTSCSPVRPTASARRTTNPGRRLGPASRRSARRNRIDERT